MNRAVTNGSTYYVVASSIFVGGGLNGSHDYTNKQLIFNARHICSFWLITVLVFFLVVR